MRFCGAFTIPDATGKSTNKMQFVESTIKVTNLASILGQCCAVLAAGSDLARWINCHICGNLLVWRYLVLENEGNVTTETGNSFRFVGGLWHDSEY